ncbi:MAG: hypothetical protein JST85_12860 [Acidobacteria bacterium]|nr:hypothetical protein [Acidobacteriota bacterium]
MNSSWIIPRIDDRFLLILGFTIFFDRVVPDVSRGEAQAVDSLTNYGDAGYAILDIFILCEARIANFSGLAALEQVVAMAEAELKSLLPATKLVVIACPKHA